MTNPHVFQNHAFEDISYFKHSNEYARELALGLGFLNGPAHRERHIASALVCNILLLALHPKITEEVLQETNDQLQGRTITADDLDHLPLLEGVVMETLRMLPPQYWLIRISRAPYVLDGYEYPTGSNVLLSPYVTHRMPELYPDPQHFNPRRWIGAQHKPFSFIPFAGGVRHCLGSVYSLHLCITVIATLLQRYSISLLPRTKLDLTGLRRAFPRNGTMLKLGRPGIPSLPDDLTGNYTRFVNVNA